MKGVGELMAKKSLLFAVILVLLLSVFHTSLAASKEDEIKSMMKTTYAAAYKLGKSRQSNMEGGIFKGPYKGNDGKTYYMTYCSLCAGEILVAAGVIPKYLPGNGNAAYGNYSKSAVKGNYTKTVYPGSSYTIEQVCNAINKKNKNGDPTYVIFCFGKGSSSVNGQAYGHAVTVQCIYNGKVYFSEWDGAVYVKSISEFAKRYKQENFTVKEKNGTRKGTKYKFDGAVEFSNLQDAVEDQYTITKDNTWYGRTSKKTTTYEWEDEKLVAKGSVDARSGLYITEKIVGKKDASDKWYKTNYGYIRMADIPESTVKTFTSKWAKEGETKETSEAYSTVVTPIYDEVWLEMEPYSTYNSESDHMGMIPVKKGELLTVESVWKNKWGNYWIKLKNGFYICVNNVKEVPQASAEEDVTITNPTFPTGDIKQASFDLRGEVKSKYIITKASGGIYTYDEPYTNISGTQLYKEISPNKKEFNLYSSDINVSSKGGIKFANIPNKNRYSFRLIIQYDKLVWQNQSDAKKNPLVGSCAQKVFMSKFSVGLGKDGLTEGEIETEVKATGITLSNNAFELQVGATFNIVPTVTPTNATNKKVEWTSSNTSIATVKDGKVTAVGKGTVVITATALSGNNIKAICTITVTKKVTDVKISPQSTILYLNEKKTLAALVSPSDASETGVEWSSSNGNAIVNKQTGEVTAVSVGNVTVTAKATDGSGKQGTCSVEVRSYVDSVIISGNETVNVGSSIRLSPTLSPSNAYNKDIVWTSSDTTIATVDTSGNVKGIKPGTVTITAKATDRGTKTGTKTITVKQPVTGIILSGTETVLRGTNASLTTVITPANASNKTITWSSENPAIAEVNNGVVTTKTVGSTTIWAIAADGSGTKARFYVTVEEPVAQITISGEETVPVDGTIQLSTTISPANAGNKSVLWSTDQSTIATINNQGILKGIQTGTVTVTATASDGSGVSAEYSVRVVKQLIAVQINGDSSVHTGQEKQLTAVVTSDQPLEDTGVIWSSSDESVVTVTASGKIRGVGNGTAIITATSKAENYYSASHTVKVTTLVNGITISGNNEIDESNDTQLRINITPATASNRNVAWTASDSTVANVDGSGKVYAVSEGTAVITVSATDGSGISETFEIRVYPLPHSITISGENALLVEDTVQLTATVLPENARNKNVIWASSDETIATVDASGLVTAVGNGTVTITGSAVGNDTVFDTHQIIVTTLVSSIEFTAPEKINVGDSDAVIAEILPVTASNQELAWSSSDEELAVVDAKGNVTALAPGFVTITAAATDGSDITTETEIEIFQLVQNISIDIEPIGYIGKKIYPKVIVYPDDASNPLVEYTVDNENIAEIDSFTETNGPFYFLACKEAGLVQITATAVDGSDVTGSAYVLVLPYTELRNQSEEYTVYIGGQSNSPLGTVSLSSDCAYRAAEDKYGAVWTIEHVSGDYAVVLGMNENNATYNGFSLAGSVDLNLLRINRTGTDVYRISCTIFEQTVSCDVTIHVVQPDVPLPDSVSLPTTTYNGQVNETISIDITSPVILPAGAALPTETNVFLYGQGTFNRYAQVTMDDDLFTVKFNKAGAYSAYVRYSGVNYEYDAEVQFIITSTSGTVPPDVEEITIQNQVKYMLVGETSSFDVNVIPSAADDTDLLWSSSDPDVVSVTADGVLTALQTGTSVITVSSDNGVTATGFVAVTETLLSIDWNDDDVIEVYAGGSTRTIIQRVYLSSRASAQLTEAPIWSLKRIDGNNLTLTCEPITGKDSTGQDLYGCAIILKSVSAIGMTEYELTCSDGLYSTSTAIKVNANEVESRLPSMISWSNATFTGRVNELLSIRPVIQCWPDGTALPDSVIVSIEGDQYWNAALNSRDYAISRNAMTFSFNEPGVYTANCIYSCSNMRYLVPITVRIADSDGVIPVRATNLTLNESEVSIRVGNTAQLKAVIAPEDATDKNVSWSSENPSVASVSSDGLITGMANGRTNIWCTPDDPNCVAVKCIVVVEDEFSIIQTDEMTSQYLQGEAGNTVASFKLSTGTARRLQEAGLTPTWSFSRVSGNASEVDLIENNGIKYLVATKLLSAGTDTFNISCTAGNYNWNGQATLTVVDLGSSTPISLSISQTSYTATVGEEIELDFTPVCSPNGTSIPSSIRSNYIGIGQFYNGLVSSYKTQIMTTKQDKVKVAFKKKGTYLLSRYYRDHNLTFVTECTIDVGDGAMSLLKCRDQEATVYIGGKPGIASTCVISDTSIEELYGDEILWSAERLSGDCLHVALRVDQSSALLYVVDAIEPGEEVWRVSCSFRGITDYIDVTIQAVEPIAELPENVSLLQTEFDGMVGNMIAVTLAVQCEPEGTGLPSIEDEAWTFVADGNTNYYSTWTIKDNRMNIGFKESGYYGGRLVYSSGNISYSFSISFAIMDEESILPSPSQMDVSLNEQLMTVYPEGEINVPVVNAILSDSLDMYSLDSIAAYAQSKNATWSLEILSGNACYLSLRQVSSASVQIVLGEITGTGDVSYRVSCLVEGNSYSADGIIHVATSTEERPCPEVKQTYFLTSVGTMITIDASFYDRTSNLKLCAGKDSIWENTEALAAMGYDYQVSGDFLMPVFYQTGIYTTTISNRVSNLICSQRIKIVVHTPRPLPDNPSMLMMSQALQEIDKEAFEGVKTNVIDLRGTQIRTIKSRAFANIDGLIRVYIPSGVTSISSDAFEGCADIEIFCVQGSYADTWAQGVGYPVNYDMN